MMKMTALLRKRNLRVGEDNMAREIYYHHKVKSIEDAPKLTEKDIINRILSFHEHGRDAENYVFVDLIEVVGDDEEE